MSGTPFTVGQLAKLQSDIAIAVSTALPKVVKKFDDPKEVMNALYNRGGLFARYVENALVHSLKKMLVLVPRERIALTYVVEYDPRTYDWESLMTSHMGRQFLKIVPNSVPVSATTFLVGSADLNEDVYDNELVTMLPKKHIFDEKHVCAIIVHLLDKQPNGEEGNLVTDTVNLFYYNSEHDAIIVYWDEEKKKWQVGTAHTFAKRQQYTRIFYPFY